MYFDKPFDKFVCVGDEITATIGELSFRARVECDDTPDTPDQRQDGFWPSNNPDDAGWIGKNGDLVAAQKRAQYIMDSWRADDWFYCGIVVSVWVGDHIINDHATSLWGIEANYPPSEENTTPNDYLTKVARELLPEAIDVARLEIDGLLESCEKAKQSLATAGKA